MASPPFITLQQHIMEEQRRHHPHASGEFSWLLSGITLATKIVADQVRRAGLADVLGPVGRQLAAGYVVYGSSTMLVYTAGMGVFGFTLDPSFGAYVLTHERITMPPRGNTYSVNEANADSFPEPYRVFLAYLRA